MKKNILVTGSSGFIGKHLVTQLKIEGHTVFEFTTDDGDISSKDLQFKKMPNIHHVFHLAAKTHVTESWSKPSEYYRINVLGTENVLEFCRKNACDLTFMSSYLYGIPNKLPTSEDDELKPNTPYTHSKFLAESLCKFYADHFNTKVIVLRPFNVYGPNQKESFLIPSLISQALNKNKEVIELSDLEPKRDYIYIKDVIRALILTMNSLGTCRFSVYNVGTGTSQSVEEVVKAVLKSLNIEKRYISTKERRINEIMNVIADISKIKKELNWEPQYSFHDGITETIQNIHK